MVDQGRNICSTVSFPVLGDGDTGYGNPINVRRTVQGYARAGFACIMIEDQVSPKRCGHTRGKQTVSRGQAFARIQAAIDARNEGADILIMARTDARATVSLEEAIYRARRFVEMGVDITFLEAPLNEKEMRAYCDHVPGPRMANMVEQGDTPLLSPARLQEIGYRIVAYPLTLMLSGIRAMEDSLSALQQGNRPPAAADFAHLREIVGFPEYFEAERKYAAD
jgi:2-methylisocitrate lyase-like PEP mutase family enzyme